MSRYRVVKAYSTDDLVRMVSQAMDEGWHVHGPMSAVLETLSATLPDRRSGTTNVSAYVTCAYVQPMTRRAERVVNEVIDRSND